MVDIHDRRSGRPDFADGSSQFAMPDQDDETMQRWGGQAPTFAAKREVHRHYAGQRSTQTWQEANRLASRRTWRSGGPWDESSTTAGYAQAYQDHLVNILASKGPGLAKKYGEIRPGR